MPIGFTDLNQTNKGQHCDDRFVEKDEILLGVLLQDHNNIQATDPRGFKPRHLNACKNTEEKKKQIKNSKHKLMYRDCLQ